jgi:hypothetical protein
MVRSLMALVVRRVLAWLVRSKEHAKDLEIVVRVRPGPCRDGPRRARLRPPLVTRQLG